MTPLPRLRPVNPPAPDPVAGYMVVRQGDRPVTTNTDVVDRETAAADAARWAAHTGDPARYRLVRLVYE